MVAVVYIELATLIPVSICASLIGFLSSEVYAKAQIERITNPSSTIQIPCINIRISSNVVVTLNWGVFGFSIVTEMFMIYIFLSESQYLPLGLVILLTRLTNPIVTIYILFRTLHQRKSSSTIDIEKERLVESQEKIFNLQPFNDRLLTVFLIGAAFYELSMLSFLPWQNKDLYFNNVAVIKSSKLFHACIGTLSPIIWLIYSVQSEVASSIAIVSLSLMTSFMILAFRLVALIRREQQGGDQVKKELQMSDKTNTDPYL
jgi:hypothetical protein